MLYLKNLRTWESVARVAVGAAMVAVGLLGIQGRMLAGLVAATGAVFVLTGLFGWCPMCAMVGRKL